MSLNEANQSEESLPLYCSSRYCLAPLVHRSVAPDMLRVLGVVTQDSKVTPVRSDKGRAPPPPQHPGAGDCVTETDSASLVN